MPNGANVAGGRAPAIAALLAIATLSVHVLAYAWTVADPVVVSDAWHFIDLVIRPYATGEFGIGDLFVKRNALDHSQPLNKLVSIANYEWFDLDYRYEAMFGALCACASVAILWIMWRRARGARGATGPEALAMVAVAAVYLSIGASTAYSWPLVAMGFTTHLFVLGMAWAAWRMLAAPGLRNAAVLCATTLLAGIVADDVGLVAAIAIVLSSLVVAARERAWRPALSVVLLVVSAMAIYLVLYRLLSATPQHGGAAPPLASGVVALLAKPDAWWSLLAPPLAASVAHRVVLAEWFGAGNAESATHAIAALLLACHAWFWWTAVRGGARMNVLAYVSMVLMLLFYGLVAALWLTRIAQFGADYLWQPRYAVLYRWNLVALLLMLLAQLAPAHSAAARPGARIARRAMLAVAALLLSVQLPLARASWKEAPYIGRYHAREARQLVEMAARGGEPPRTCIATLVVCRFPDARRRQVIGFLQQHRLNVFDPEVREALGLEPAATR